MINHPSRSNPVLTIARLHVGYAHTITRRDMRNILNSCAFDGVVNLGNGWGGSRSDKSNLENAEIWADACRGIIVISVLAPRDRPRYGSNLGDIRFDEPDSMHPGLRATLMFISAHADHDLDFLRKRAKRVLIVDGNLP